MWPVCAVCGAVCWARAARTPRRDAQASGRPCRRPTRSSACPKCDSPNPLIADLGITKTGRFRGQLFVGRFSLTRGMFPRWPRRALTTLVVIGKTRLWSIVWCAIDCAHKSESCIGRILRDTAVVHDRACAPQPQPPQHTTHPTRVLHPHTHFRSAGSQLGCATPIG